MKTFAKSSLLALMLGISATAIYADTVTKSAVSPEGLVKEAESLHAQAVADLRHVLHLQAVARKDKDVVKLNCVNEKLVQIKPQLNILEDAQATLSSATEPEGPFATVQGSANSVHVLREEAAQCVGESEFGTDTSNRYTHPNIVDDPFTDPWAELEVEAPGYASPFT